MIDRLIVTGAAGGIGTLLAGRLDHLARSVVRSDLAEVEVSGREISRPADLTDLAQVRALLKGGGDVLHFGGQSVEAPWEVIRERNLVGTYNLYEAARLEGVRRVLFASSNHAIGFHERTTMLDSRSPTRPDSLYGVSKVFGEALASLYHDKFGIESVSLRIGTCIERPKDRRHLATWLSPDDMVRLVERMVRASKVGHSIVYGASANAERWWDDRETRQLGWVPRDSSQPWADELEGNEEDWPPDAARTRFQGGVFCEYPHPDD